MDIQEAWQTYTALDGSTEQVRKGSRIAVSIRDLMQLIVDYKFLAPEAAQKNDAWAEITRLVGTQIFTLKPSWYTATTIKSGTAYGDSRMDAIKGWAAALNADPIIDPNGNFTLAKKTPDKTSIPNVFSWDTNLVDYSKSLSRDGVYNVVVCKGKNAVTSDSIVAYATLNDGPTAWNGPFGVRPVYYSNDALGTKELVQTWANSLLATMKTQNTQVVQITCLPNPAIELGDYANLTLRGSNATMQGRVIGFTYRAKGPMDVVMSMPNSWAA